MGKICAKVQDPEPSASHKSRPAKIGSCFGTIVLTQTMLNSTK
jgi:hypothetical protein